MRKHDRRRHELRGFVARVAEHYPLVARALFGSVFSFRRARIDSLRDVGRLAGENVLDVDLVRVKNVVVVYVPDLAHAFAHDLRNGKSGFERTVLGQIRNGDFSADNNGVTLGVSLARDSTILVLTNAGIEDGVGNGVTDFVGMTFADRFGRKDVASRHKKR